MWSPWPHPRIAGKIDLVAVFRGPDRDLNRRIVVGVRIAVRDQRADRFDHAGRQVDIGGRIDPGVVGG